MTNFESPIFLCDPKDPLSDDMIAVFNPGTDSAFAVQVPGLTAFAGDLNTLVKCDVARPTSEEFFVAAGGDDTAAGNSWGTALESMQEAFDRSTSFTRIYASGTVLADPTNTIMRWDKPWQVSIIGYNNFTVSTTNPQTALFRIDDGTVVLVNGTYRAAVAQHGIRLGSANNPRLLACNVTAEGATNGWTTSNNFDECVLVECTGLGVTNDGFNIHGDPGVTSETWLIDCIGNDCGDEGASPHDDTVLNIVGGEYRRNGGGNLNAVGNSVMNIGGGTVSADSPNTVQGGSSWNQNATGSVCGFITENNAGPGFLLLDSSIVGVDSITSTGNGVADSVSNGAPSCAFVTQASQKRLLASAII